MEGLLQYWPVAVVIFNVAGVWIIWSLKRQFATKDELAVAKSEIGRRTGEVEQRLSKVEVVIENAPTKDDFHEVSLGLSALHGDFKGMAASVEGHSEIMKRVEHQLGLIIQGHLKQGE